MARVRYTRLAEADLIEIGSYTLENWGETEALRYLDELEAACLRVAGQSGFGPGLREDSAWPAPD